MFLHNSAEAGTLEGKFQDSNQDNSGIFWNVRSIFFDQSQLDLYIQ